MLCQFSSKSTHAKKKKLYIMHNNIVLKKERKILLFLPCIYLPHNSNENRCGTSYVIIKSRNLQVSGFPGFLQFVKIADIMRIFYGKFS